MDTGAEGTIIQMRPKMISAAQFIILEAGLPFIVFVAAAFTALIQIVAYWPSPSRGIF